MPNLIYPADCCDQYAEDVQKFEAQGMTTSDAQGCADVEHMKRHGKTAGEYLKMCLKGAKTK